MKIPNSIIREDIDKNGEIVSKRAMHHPAVEAAIAAAPAYKRRAYENAVAVELSAKSEYNETRLRVARKADIKETNLLEMSLDAYKKHRNDKNRESIDGSIDHVLGLMRKGEWEDEIRNAKDIYDLARIVADAAYAAVLNAAPEKEMQAMSDEHDHRNHLVVDMEQAEAA